MTEEKNMGNKEKRKVLFIYSENRLRSPTAEKIFADIEGFDVRSAGLNDGAVVQLTSELVIWADVIFVMERSHQNKLLKKYRKAMNNQRIICLNIRDMYDYMDPDLIEILKSRIGSFFDTA